MKNILQLCTFPISQPITGGQRRVAAIQNMLTEMGFLAQTVCFYNSYEEPHLDYSVNDISRPSWEIYNPSGTTLLNDFYQGQYFSNNTQLIHFFSQKISSLNINTIQIEHCWLWPLVSKLIQIHNNKIQFIYSSHNIEFELKKSILEFHNIKNAEVLFQIQKLESDCIRHADIVLAVSNEDAQKIKNLGGKQVIVCPNACFSPVVPSKKTIEKWLSPFEFCFFIASGHPPNVKGFFDVLGDCLSYLPPHKKIRIAGNVGSQIRASEKFLLNPDINFSRCEFLGLISDEDVSALCSLAKVVILPITESAGSNLKTAEALVHNAIILATQAAVRGYDICGVDGCFLVEKDEFKIKLQNLMLSSKIEISNTDREIRKKFTWGHALSSFRFWLLNNS
jgi:hypothetical protein